MSTGRRHLDWLPVVGLLLLAIVPVADAAFDASKVPPGLDLIQHYSREAFTRRAFAAGVLPLWNPYEFSGFPALADPQTGVFYPPNVLLRLLPLPLFLTWTVILHLWICGVGAYLLCRVFGLRRWVACLAAVGLMLGGITMPRVYAGHFDVLRTVAWAPLAMALAVRSIDRGRIWPSSLLVITLAVQLLGSFLQIAVYTFGAITCYAIFSMVWPRLGHRSWRHTRTVFLQIIILLPLVAGLAAIQLIPTLRLITTAGRTHGMPLYLAVTPAFGLAGLARFFVPTLDGLSVPAESWETSSYIGLLLAVLAPIAIGAVRHRRATCFFLILAIGSLAFATGGRLYEWHHLLFPMFRIPGRFVLFWSIAMCVLAAIALDWLTEPPSAAADGRLTRSAVAALVLASVIIPLDLAMYARRFVGARNLTDRWSQSVPFTATPGGRVLSLCESRLLSGELSALGIASVDGYNSYFLRDYARFADVSQGERLREQIIAYPRIGAVPFAPLNWDLLGMLNVTEVASCDQLSDDPRIQLTAKQDPFLVYRNIAAVGRTVPVCHVEYADSDPTVQTLLTRPVASADTPIEAWPPSPSGAEVIETIVRPCRAVRDTRVDMQAIDGPDGVLRFTIASPAPRVLLLSEPYYWERRAFVDGIETDVRRVNLALSAVAVPRGTHVIEVRYVPTSLYAGGALTFISIVILMVRRLSPRRKLAPHGRKLPAD